MKKRSLFLNSIFLLGIIIFTACSSINFKNNKSSSEKAQYHKMTAKEAKEIIDTKEDVIIVDVRTEEEYKEAHIKNAVLIPNETIEDKKLEALPDLDAEILVYCRSGNRSKQAAKKLVEIGYTNVYDFGGILDWSYKTVSEK